MDCVRGSRGFRYAHRAASGDGVLTGADLSSMAATGATARRSTVSGEHVRHRLSRGRIRQINRMLHIMATVQLRTPTEARAYVDRKKAAGKTSMEAMRCLIGGVSGARSGRMSGRGSRSCRGGGPVAAPGQGQFESATPGAEASDRR